VNGHRYERRRFIQEPAYRAAPKRRGRRFPSGGRGSVRSPSLCSPGGSPSRIPIPSPVVQPVGSGSRAGRSIRRSANALAPEPSGHRRRNPHSSEGSEPVGKNPVSDGMRQVPWARGRPYNLRRRPQDERASNPAAEGDFPPTMAPRTRINRRNLRDSKICQKKLYRDLPFGGQPAIIRMDEC